MSNNVLEKHNTDDILIRNVIAGVLSILNNNINYEQVWDKDIIEKISLPWFFDMGNSSSERFLQDNFAYFGQQCFKKIDGNFDILPRGVLSYVSTSIDSANITNRFVEGKYSRFENGKITTYKSFLYSIPLTLRLKAEIWVDTFGNTLKIEQAIRESLYRNKTFYVMFRGMKIGCCMGIPDDYNVEKTNSFSFSTETGEQRLKLGFEIVVETYQPVFDNTMDVPSDCVMSNIGVNLSYSDIKEDNQIRIICDDVMVGGINSHIKWKFSSNKDDMAAINLEYAKIMDEEGEEIKDVEYLPIAMNVMNQNDYYWEVPIELSSSITKYNIIFNDTEDVKILKEPIIKVLPIDNKLTNDSFIVIDSGYFIVSNTNENGEISIPISLSYKKKSRFSKIKDFGVLNLVWNKVNNSNPIVLNKEVEFEDIKTLYNIRVSMCNKNNIFDEKTIKIV